MNEVFVDAFCPIAVKIPEKYTMRYYRAFLLCAAIIGLTAPLLKAEDAAKPPVYKTEENILYRDEAAEPLTDYMKTQCRLDLYHPAQQTGYTTVVWFHGGGLSAGSRFVPPQLKEQGIAVVAVGYRLHPAVKCPAYIEDAAAAVAWTFKNISRFGGNPDRIYVSGHSAGGYLTAMVGLDKRWLAKHGIDANRIAGLIPFSGHMITHMTIRKERGISDKQPIVDEFAPLFHVRPDAPPLALLLGDRELEMLGRYEENAYMARMMKVAGHKNTTLYEFQGFDHGDMNIPGHAILLKQIKKK